MQRSAGAQKCTTHCRSRGNAQRPVHQREGDRPPLWHFHRGGECSLAPVSCLTSIKARRFGGDGAPASALWDELTVFIYCCCCMFASTRRLDFLCARRLPRSDPDSKRSVIFSSSTRARRWAKSHGARPDVSHATVGHRHEPLYAGRGALARNKRSRVHPTQHT